MKETCCSCCEAFIIIYYDCDVTEVNFTFSHFYILLLLFFHFFTMKFWAELEDAIKLAKSKAIIIPFGVGVAGHVAETKEIVNIKNAYEDPRFNDEIDQKTGYKTNTILSMPICKYEGEYLITSVVLRFTKSQSQSQATSLVWLKSSIKQTVRALHEVK